MSLAAAPASPYAIHVWEGSDEGLPLVIEARGERNPAQLCRFLSKNLDWVRDRLAAHGALLFRGFDVNDAPAFERVARAIDDELKNEYLGTSPRNALTSHVFTASELPPYFPIMQHCEMSFTAQPPRRLFFCCLVEPAQGSGETPLTDFRRVLRELDPQLVKRWEEIQILPDTPQSVVKRMVLAMLGADDPETALKEYELNEGELDDFRALKTRHRDEASETWSAIRGGMAAIRSVGGSR